MPKAEIQRKRKKNRILPLRFTDDEWWILTIPYTAVPGYDFKAACRGLTEEGIRQEILIDWSATKGQRIYKEFGREHHVATESLEFNPRLPLYCGWDFGGCPAFVVTQLNSFGQWMLFPTLSPPEEATLGVYEFGEMVADYLTQEFALPAGLESFRKLKTIHYGDPAGQARPPRTGDSPKELRSCFEILEKGVEFEIVDKITGRPKSVKRPGFGWKILPGPVNITDRLEAVRARLRTTLHDGLPALVVDPDATTLIEGFLGGYCRKLRADGTYTPDPDKNWYSHSFDALAYVAARVFHTATEEEPDEDEETRDEFVSHAGRRGSY